MAGEYTPRHGFNSEEVATIYARWRYLDGQENWGSLDNFCKWLSEVGYKKGMHIRKHDKTQPHSQENSYFQVYSYAADARKAKIQEFRAIKSDFCVDCQLKACPNAADGCKPWHDWFVKNWNDKICRRKPDTKPEEPMVFRYEHPDLVREGIVFVGST